MNIQNEAELDAAIAETDKFSGRGDLTKTELARMVELADAIVKYEDMLYPLK